MYRRISKSFITITPEDAKHFLYKNTLKAQRYLSLDHIKYLAKCITSGTFDLGDIALAVNGNSSTEILVNGQHQLNAVIMCGRPIEAVHRVFKCENESDVYAVYSIFDMNRTRSLSELLRIVVEKRHYFGPPRYQNL